MRIISVRQPYASLIVLGIKNVENRTWQTGYRGKLYIHASKTPISQDDVMVCKRICRQAGVPFPEELPVGGIIGSVDFTGLVWNDGEELKSDHPTIGINDLRGYNRECFGFILENPVQINLIPLRGKLGLFKPDFEIMAALTA